MNEQQKAFWQRFLAHSGLPSDTKCYEFFAFGVTKRETDELLRLVLSGKKRATSSSREAYRLENSPLPAPGGLSVVLDGAGVPACVIETTQVRVFPFEEMTFEICAEEGEDETLASWQEAHIRHFEAEAKEAGYAFSPKMPIVFENFRMIYREKAPAKG